MRTVFALTLLAAAAAAAGPLAAEERGGEESVKVEVQKGEKDAAKDPAALEKSVTTPHSAQVGGRSIAYKATAGTLTIRDDKGKPDASVFYVAYTADGDGGTKRPVTFLYNGGPGSSSIWLHMGSFAPVRIVTASPDPTAPAPYQLVPNADSLLDKTDLVFVDAIGTGYSKGLAKLDASKDLREQAKEKEENQNKRFWGTDQDIDAFGRFVLRYITVNNRWNSPKFLFGESYGTPRSAGLVRWLDEKGVACNGVVLLSSILNYGTRLPGQDNDYIGNLPTFAAIAWYHNKLPNKPATLEPFLSEVRDFARGEYAMALSKGQALSAQEQDAIAAKLNKYTGLSAAYVKEANLRVSPSRFRKELLRDERHTVGRYDGRFEGIDSDSAGENPESDASDTAIRGAFTAAFNDYLVRELHWSSDVQYNVSAPAIMEWDWKHKAPGQNPRPLPLPIMVADLGATMRANPHLKVMAANGYFDLATPFFATEYDLAHLDVEPKLRQNLTLTYYPSGHMVYLNLDALKQFKGDLAKFYDSAVGR